MSKNTIITLMFSGGIDSTYAAAMLSKQYDTIHLVSYFNSYGNQHIQRTKIRANELNKKFPAKFIHHTISIDEYLEKIILNSIQEDYHKYKSAFIWCMGCKIAMHTMSIVFNKKNNITLMTDGSSMDTEEMVEQMPSSIEKIHNFYKANGITAIIQLNILC